MGRRDELIKDIWASKGDDMEQERKEFKENNKGKSLADVKNDQLDSFKHMKKFVKGELIEIIGFGMEKERAECMADEVMELMKRYKFYL